MNELKDIFSSFFTASLHCNVGWFRRNTKLNLWVAKKSFFFCISFLVLFFSNFLYKMWKRKNIEFKEEEEEETMAHRT